jgi:D-beta-D-heptose 7-phosphate kinase/D-beta-D-heptose 1-phosphate adenosyltransferase
MSSKLDIPSFKQARVLVVGDVMLDRYWHGGAERISPEAPVPVVKVRQARALPGGAANVALNINAIGAMSTMVGLIGDDKEGAELSEQLIASGVSSKLIESEGYATTTKLRVLAQDQQLIRVDFEGGFSDSSLDDLLQVYEDELANHDVVVLSDYAKGLFANPQPFIEKARARNIPVLIDPKLKDFSNYAGATLVTPNLKEFEAVAGPSDTVDEIIEKATDLIHRLEINAMLITRGKQGMVLVQQGCEPIELSARARDVYDVTGAGDTVIGVFSAVIAAGMGFSHAMMLSNVAAGIVVKKLGAASVSEDEIREELQRINDSHVGIVTEEQLLQSIQDAVAKGQKIVMTNGCFDVLHAGHVQYLEQAKDLGERLVVAVNNDASVAQLKGDSRPLNELQARMEVLAALRSVDWVVPFSEDTPARLIGEVLPDVLVKGGDYQPQEIAGYDAVVKTGGEVKVLSFKEGFSTTGLVNKIREGA